MNLREGYLVSTVNHELTKATCPIHKKEVIPVQYGFNDTIFICSKCTLPFVLGLVRPKFKVIPAILKDLLQRETLRRESRLEATEIFNVKMDNYRATLLKKATKDKKS